MTIRYGSLVRHVGGYTSKGLLGSLWDILSIWLFMEVQAVSYFI